MKFAVIGAGAIGGYLGGRLAQSGHDVVLVARGAHLDALQSQGLRIESPDGNAEVHPRAVNTIEGIGVVDVVLATVKLPDLKRVASQIPSLMGNHTRVVTLQNGIDARNILGEFIDANTVAQGVIYLAAHIKEPGVIKTPGGKHLMLIDGLDGDATMRQFFDAIDKSVAIDVTPVTESDKTIWAKFTAQASIAAVTSLTRMSLGGVFRSPEATTLLEQLLAEAIAIADAVGVDLPADHAQTAIALYSAQPDVQSSSLIVDILAGKPTELRYLSGRVHEMGLELNIPTPAHTTAWNALSAYAEGRPAFAL